MPLAKLSLPNPLDLSSDSILNTGLLAKPNEDENSGTSDLLLGSLFSSSNSINANSSSSSASAAQMPDINPTGILGGIANAVGTAKLGGALVDKLFPSAAEIPGDTLLKIPGSVTIPAINDISGMGAEAGFINSSTLAAANAPTSIFTKAKIFASSPVGAGTLTAIPSLIKGDVKGAAGSGLGAYAALAAFPGSPIIAPIVGAFLGKGIVNKGLKAVGIGGGKSIGPNAGISGLVGDDGLLKLGDAGADNGANTGFVTSFLSNVAKTVNSTLNERGDKLELPANSRPLYIEVLKGKLNVYDAPGSFRSFDANQVDQAFNYAVSTTLKGKAEANVRSPEANKITSELDKALLEIFGKKKGG